MASARKQAAQRQQLAQIAAQLMAEQGIRDFRIAKQKAAQQMGINPRSTALPKNTEVEAALAEHQRLFAGEEQPAQLLAMRRSAISAMRFLAEFRPRLVGDVLSGLANAHSDIQLHVFADHSESFDLFLDSKGISFDLVDRRYRFANDYYFYPAFRFLAGEHGFEATLFPQSGLREAPRSLVDGLPMQRANIDEVEQLVAQTEFEDRMRNL